MSAFTAKPCREQPHLESAVIFRIGIAFKKGLHWLAKKSIRIMKKRANIAVQIFAGLAMSIMSALAGNVLTNPGFESDAIGETSTLLGWNTYGGNAYSETSATIAHGGTNYFKVYQAFNGQVNYTGIYQDYISGPGATYSADGWAYTSSGDVLAGQNVAWIEVTFRDASANVLALYRSSFINTNIILAGTFPKNTWIDLPVTNQYNPNTFAITNRTAVLTAPVGTYFVRYQIVLQGDSNLTANGSVCFDDLTLNLTSVSAYGNWNIVWSDEFNGIYIDTRKRPTKRLAWLAMRQIITYFSKKCDACAYFVIFLT